MTAAPDTVVAITRPVEHVALVTINRQEARNAIDGAVTRELARAAAETEADDAVRAVVLTGAGSAFCAGADLKAVQRGEQAQLLTPEGGFAGFVEFRRTKPWIAAVNGPALAGGCELVLACDMAVASERATFGLPEVRRGLVAAGGGVARLSRWLPRALAMEIALTGRPIDAAEAVAHGMVNRLVPRGALIRSALALAQEIAANAPLAPALSSCAARLTFPIPSSFRFARPSRGRSARRSSRWTGSRSVSHVARSITVRVKRQPPLSAHHAVRQSFPVPEGRHGWVAFPVV